MGHGSLGGQTELDCQSTHFMLLHVLTCHAGDDGLHEDDDDDDDHASCDDSLFSTYL